LDYFTSVAKAWHRSTPHSVLRKDNYLIISEVIEPIPDILYGHVVERFTIK
jgi:hypothetical protein